MSIAAYVEPRLVPKRSSPASKRPVRDRIADFPSFPSAGGPWPRPDISGNLTKPFSCNSIKCQIGSGGQPRSQIFETSDRPFSVKCLLEERFGIPFATLGCKKVAIIDMDRTGQPGQRVGNGMHHVSIEQLCIAVP